MAASVSSPSQHFASHQVLDSRFGRRQGVPVRGSNATQRLVVENRCNAEDRALTCRAVAAPVTTTSSSFTLRAPPYPMEALEPYMGKATLEYHWGKHHRTYYDNLNKQIEGTDLGGNTLEEIIKISYNNGNPLPVFNNAAQAWNHDFFWQSMAPGGGGKPSGEILQLIVRDFGSFENFVTDFKSAGATQFGSGWAWLVLKREKLVVEKTPNAINPLIWGHIPLLTMDVWEHAYYLDYQNRRPDYITAFVDHLISWDAVAARLERAKAFVNLGEPEIPEV
eukprot:TRINITY_DN8009_c0_g1_i2.p1 TRINITY_DN8009_c0_g1~~TRINITY_DN8009_c0_g1_i2.p1  ORF type:complete len:279 (+),score=51.22 TRINITY_DN8009_c0_g1_i2:21-857(+)